MIGLFFKTRQCNRGSFKGAKTNKNVVFGDGHKVWKIIRVYRVLIE